MKSPNRIQEKIKFRASGCWEWTGAVGQGGYGNAWFEGRHVNAHRLVYLFEIGPIPRGRYVCHTCDNRLCVNPGHLYLATQKKNLEDMRLKDRHSSGETHAEAIRRGWTPELRAMRKEQTRKRREKEHNTLADAAGVPRDWKYCPRCDHWFPRSNFHKNKARHDGLKPYCKPCAVAKERKRKQRKFATI